jgi:hypothetical protein
MTARIEWRSNGSGDDALLFVGEFGEAGNTVLKLWEVTPALLTNFLNTMSALDTEFSGLETKIDQREPEQWGNLVLTRAADGQVLQINPELYWDAIYYWFRARGADPHKMREITP